MSWAWSSGVSMRPGRRDDDVEVEGGEVDAGGGADTVETADDAQRVLGGKPQHAAGARDGPRRRWCRVGDHRRFAQYVVTTYAAINKDCN